MWRLWLSEPFQLASASVDQSCCVIIFNICRAMGPWSEGIWENMKGELQLSTQSKCVRILHDMGPLTFFKNTGPKLVQFWVVNSTKLKWIRRVSQTNYIFLCKISGGVSEIQPKLLHPYVMYHVTSFEDPIEGKVFVGLVESSSDAWRGGIIQGGPPQFIKAG